MPTPFDPAAVPIFEDRLSSIMSVASIVAWDSVSDIDNGIAYFGATGFTNGNVLMIDGSNRKVIPTQGPPLIADYAEIQTIENNIGTFFEKQEMLFFKESIMYDAWISAIKARVHAVATLNPGNVYAPSVYTVSDKLSPPPVKSVVTVGPYIDLSFGSESNKYYGISNSNKSAWLQRSLTKGISFTFNKQTVTTDVNAAELNWYLVVTQSSASGNTVTGTFTNLGTYASIGSFLAAAQASFPTAVSMVEYAATLIGSGSPTFDQRRTIGFYDSGAALVAVAYPGTLSAGTLTENNRDGPTGVNKFALGIGKPVYKSDRTLTQSLKFLNALYTTYPTCTYKQLGHTKIKGHGHFVP